MSRFVRLELLQTFAFLLAGGLSGASLATESMGMGAETFLGDVPVFLTVTRLPQSPSETPASVTIIDRRMIEAAGAVEVADLLRLVPGFVVGHYKGPDGNRTVVSYYGASDQYARRLQVLVDGMSVYMPATGGVEWPDLPLAVDDIERIEVVRGPNGATYGSNSFLGVINIITRHPEEAPGVVRVTAGSVDYREALFRVSGGEKFQQRLTGTYRSSHGYRNLHAGTERDYEVNDDSVTRTLAWRGDYRSSVNDYWTFHAAHGNGPRQVGSSTDPLNPVRTQRMETDSQQVHWRRLLDSDSELEVQAYRNHHLKRDRFRTGWLSDILSAVLETPITSEQVPYVLDMLGLPAEGDQQLEADTGLESERQDVEVSYRFRPAVDWRLVVGGAYRIDEARGVSYFDTGRTFTSEGARLFFNAEWKPDPAWTVNIGDLYEQNQLVGSVHSPRLSLSRRLFGPHYVRASGSRAYRNPAFAEEEIEFNYRFNDGVVLHNLYTSPFDIKPERIESVELAVGGDSNVYSYELKRFHSEINSLVTLAEHVPEPLPVWWMMNGGKLTIDGTEFQFKAQPQPDVLFALGIAVANATGWTLDTPDTRKDISNSVPASTFSLLLAKRFDSGDQAGLTIYSIAPVQHFAGDLTQGVNAVDVNYSHPFRWYGRQAKARLLFRDVVGSYYDFEEETNRGYEAFLTLETEI